VSTRVWGGVVTPRFVVFDLSPMLGTRLRSVAGLSEEIALALGVSFCRIYREGGAMRIEVPRRGRQPVSLLGLCRCLKNVPPASVVMGIDRAGKPLVAPLSSPDVVHILVSGTTGSGKTEALRSMVMSLAYLNRQHDCQMLLIDPKSRGLMPFRALPHLMLPPLTNPGDAQEALEDLAQEMERRDRGQIERPRIVVVIDELADLLMTGGPIIKECLSRLIQRGRGAGIHVIAATQKPSAEVLSAVIRSNFPMRVVGRVVSAGDALIAAGIPGTGAERLLGRGDMLAVSLGQSRRFQSAFISEAEIAKAVRWLQIRQHSPARITLPAPQPAESERELTL
jgi:DNA segregation ATPase FtsK/SpoIIIE, S-DNA-T family